MDAGRMSAIVSEKIVMARANEQWRSIVPPGDLRSPTWWIVQACLCPNFCVKYGCRIPARERGRQSKAWGGARRRATPGMTRGLSHQPVKRAAAIDAAQ